MNMRTEPKRRENEKKFDTYEELPNSGRRYSYKVKSRSGWTARYVKDVDATEQTLRFYQEIYDDTGKLTEIHEKYPIDKGHRKVEVNAP